jgi:hypothetical protein
MFHGCSAPPRPAHLCYPPQRAPATMKSDSASKRCKGVQMHSWRGRACCHAPSTHSREYVLKHASPQTASPSQALPRSATPSGQPPVVDSTIPAQTGPTAAEVQREADVIVGGAVAGDAARVGTSHGPHVAGLFRGGLHTRRADIRPQRLTVRRLLGVVACGAHQKSLALRALIVVTAAPRHAGALPCLVSPPQPKPALDKTTIESPNARQRAMRRRTTLAALPAAVRAGGDEERQRAQALQRQAALDRATVFVELHAGHGLAAHEPFAESNQLGT